MASVLNVESVESRPLLILAFSLAITLPGNGADFLDLFKSQKNPDQDGADAGISLAGLSQEQMIQGLKEALAKGVQHSITNLGRDAPPGKNASHHQENH
jgi:hypothetical protein